MKLGFNWIAAGAIAFLVIAIFQPGFLAPVFLFELKYLFRERCDANRLLAGASIAGLCAVFLTNAPGYSHFTFLQYSNIAMSIIGAQGAVRIANRVQNGWCWRLLSLVLATAGLLVLQVIQIPPWLAGATWANLAAKHAVYVMPGGAQALHPDISSCVRPADLEMLRTIQRIDRKSIVVIPDVGNAAACEAIWWTAYVPLQTLQTYGVVNEPGAGSEKFQDRVAQLSAAFGDVRSQAAKGEVEVGKLSKLAALLQTERPVFVVLKKDVHLIGGPPLASIFANDRFVALQLPNSGTAAVSLP